MFNNEIVLTFDQATLMEYRKQYFINHPRARKFPFKEAIPPSLNQFLVMKRPQQNATKQLWKEFGMYVAKDYAGLNLTRCEIEMHFTFKDKRRRDIDNYLGISNKLLFDAISAEEGIGIITDDSYSVITKVTGTAQYEKGVSKLEMIIRY